MSHSDVIVSLSFLFYITKKKIFSNKYTNGDLYEKMCRIMMRVYISSNNNEKIFVGYKHTVFLYLK